MALSKDIKKKQNQNTENGVVITVYVESSRTRSSNKLSNKDPSKKIKPKFESKATCGYDRKAQLLEYSRYLRKIEASQNVEAQSQTKTKKRLWSQMTQSLVTFLEPKGSMKRKCKGNKCCYLFMMKLKNMLKKLSCKDIKW